MYFLILGGGDAETGIRRSMSLQVILFIFYHCITDMVISDISRSNEWSLEVQITCLCSNMCTLRSHRHIIIAVFNVEFLHWELIFFNVKHRQNYGKLRNFLIFFRAVVKLKDESLNNFYSYKTVLYEFYYSTISVVYQKLKQCFITRKDSLAAMIHFYESMQALISFPKLDYNTYACT